MSSILKRVKKKNSFNDNIAGFRNYTQRVSGNDDNVSKIYFMSDEMIKSLWKEIDSSEPTDIIKIKSLEESLSLLEKWSVIGDKNFYVPANIFLEKTIPIYDFVLMYHPLEDNDENFYPTYRFVIFNNFENMMLGDDKILLGTIIANFDFVYEKFQITNSFHIEKNTIS